MTITKMLKITDLMSLMQISRTKAYELANSNAFKVVRIGKCIRIPWESFQCWMSSASIDICDSDTFCPDKAD